MSPPWAAEEGKETWISHLLLLLKFFFYWQLESRCYPACWQFSAVVAVAKYFLLNIIR